VSQSCRRPVSGERAHGALRRDRPCCGQGPVRSAARLGTGAGGRNRAPPSCADQWRPPRRRRRSPTVCSARRGCLNRPRVATIAVPACAFGHATRLYSPRTPSSGKAWRPQTARSARRAGQTWAAPQRESAHHQARYPTSRRGPSRAPRQQHLDTGGGCFTLRDRTCPPMPAPCAPPRCPPDPPLRTPPGRPVAAPAWLTLRPRTLPAPIRAGMGLSNASAIRGSRRTQQELHDFLTITIHYEEPVWTTATTSASGRLPSGSACDDSRRIASPPRRLNEKAHPDRVRFAT
jgi:hypothetical protein